VEDLFPYRPAVFKIPTAVNLGHAGDAARGTAIGHAVAELAHVGGFMLAWFWEWMGGWAVL